MLEAENSFQGVDLINGKLFMVIRKTQARIIGEISDKLVEALRQPLNEILHDFGVERYEFVTVGRGERKSKFIFN